MICDNCTHVIVRKRVNGQEAVVELFCEVDGYHVTSGRFPLTECNRKKIPDPIPAEIRLVPPVEEKKDVPAQAKAYRYKR